MHKTHLYMQTFSLDKISVYLSNITVQLPNIFFFSLHLLTLMALQITATAFSFEKRDVSLTQQQFCVYASTLWRYAYHYTVSAVVCCTYIYNVYIKDLPDRLTFSFTTGSYIILHFPLSCQKLFHFWPKFSTNKASQK